MRFAIALALLVAAVVPGAALAAEPSPAWPAVKDIVKMEPGLKADDAACMARYYRGRLSRKAWLTSWSGLTRKQMVATEAGVKRCTTQPERVAMLEHDFETAAGSVAGMQCVARAVEAVPLAARLTYDTHAKYMGMLDRAARSCRVTGALYARVAGETSLALSPAAQACANRFGAVEPVLHRKGRLVSNAHLKAIGQVFDRCADDGAATAMWRKVLNASQVDKSAIGCLSQRLAATLTFTELLSAKALVKQRAEAATAGCRASASR